MQLREKQQVWEDAKAKEAAENEQLQAKHRELDEQLAANERELEAQGRSLERVQARFSTLAYAEDALYSLCVEQQRCLLL